MYTSAPFLQAIYLDDQLSQQYIINNTIIDSDTGAALQPACASSVNAPVTRRRRPLSGLDLGGGRDVYVAGNRFRNVRLGVQFDNRGMTWQSESESDSHTQPQPCENSALLCALTRSVCAQCNLLGAASAATFQRQVHQPALCGVLPGHCVDA